MVTVPEKRNSVAVATVAKARKVTVLQLQLQDVISNLLQLKLGQKSNAITIPLHH